MPNTTRQAPGKRKLHRKAGFANCSAPRQSVTAMYLVARGVLRGCWVIFVWWSVDMTVRTWCRGLDSSTLTVVKLNDSSESSMMTCGRMC
jgi:hypothetical protein